jgi:hypothetical protein
MAPPASGFGTPLPNWAQQTPAGAVPTSGPGAPASASATAPPQPPGWGAQPAAGPGPRAPEADGFPGWEAEDPNRTEPIPDGSGWSAPAPTARGTARATGPGNGLRVTVGDLLTVAGGVFVLLFSFLPFVSYTDDRFSAVASRAKLPTSWSAWAHVTFLAPLSWVIILASVGVAALGVLRILNRWQPAVLGFEAAQLRLLLAAMSFLVLLCLALSAKTVMFGDGRPQVTIAQVKVDSTLSLSAGGYLMLLAALAMVAGTVLTLRTSGGPVVWPLRERRPRGENEYSSDYINPPPPGGYTNPPAYDPNPPVNYPDQPPRY